MRQIERPFDQYPSILISSNNVLDILANCYALCREYRARLSNACRTDARLKDSYYRVKLQFRQMMTPTNSDEHPFLLAEISKFQDLLLASSFEEMLVRAAALLQESASYVEAFLKGTNALKFDDLVTQAHIELGGESFLITPNVNNPILAHAGPFPRSEDSISETIRRYHLGVQIIPESINEFQIVRKHLALKTARLLEERIQAGSLKIASASLNADVKLNLAFPSGFPAEEPKRYVLDSIETQVAQRDCMKRILTQCREQCISVLVLPELRMPPFLRELVIDFLKNQTLSDLEAGNGLVLVVCGSWHVQDEGAYVNRSVVLDHRGQEVWTHDKLAEFNITEDNVTANPVYEELGFDKRGGVEFIRAGTRLEICDCALGRIAVAICVGFFHRPIEQVLVESGATMFFLPTMSPDTRPIEERARALAVTQRATIIVANCAYVGHVDEAGSFYKLPTKKGTAVRIKTGHDLCVLTLH
jgi:predicted amidohydrolase